MSAINTAKENGIINDQGEENEKFVCMDGKEFTEFVGGLVTDGARETMGNLENMKTVRNKLKLLVNSSPKDKYIMISGL